MPIVVFLSTVSDEFRAYRDQLVHDLTRHDVAVKVQEDFKDLGGDTLDKLDVYIAHCDAVVHLVGDMCGAAADENQQQALLAKHADLESKLSPLGEALKNGLRLAYTQWEAWLALYHGKSLLIAKARMIAPRGPKYTPDDSTRAAQADHLKRLKAFHRYPGSEFGSPDELAKQIAYSSILDLLVADYAEEEAREREVAEGFIREMAKRVAGDKALDLDGMKKAVQNAIEIYEQEIAASPAETDLAAIVSRALAGAKTHVDKGQSALARATLRRAAEEMRRDEKKRRKLYAASLGALYNRERDIALAAYDGDAAAEAIIELARSVHSANAGKIAALLSSEAHALYQYGRDRGSNVHLAAAVALRREQLALAASADERGAGRNCLGDALFILGDRESGTARLEEAITAYRVALEEYTRERVPHDWARTQAKLGGTLLALGERESGTARLEEAVTAYRAALQELPREGVPLDWARTQVGLAHALSRLGGRESGTARLEEAVAGHRVALEECTRERDPSGWALVQNNLGSTLFDLARRESATARLEEALTAFRSALEEWTRERAPLRWAKAQFNLGNVLRALSAEKKGETAFHAGLEEAVAAYRAALEEFTRERNPFAWAETQDSLGLALMGLATLETGTAKFEQAIAAYRAALEEFTHERDPLNWARTLGHQGITLMRMADQTNDAVRAEVAVRQIEKACETARSGGDERRSKTFESYLTQAQAIRDRLTGK